MKLRNKYNRLIGELYYEPEKEYHFTVVTEDPSDVEIFRTLKALAEKWEDCTPAEPLIKDEKIRKAVRAWAEANNIPDDAVLNVFEYLGSGTTCVRFDYVAKTKPFNRCVQLEYISSDEIYTEQNDRDATIAELCGEEE